MLFYIKKLWTYISLFFTRGVLSDKNIRILLGYHIFIYPFKEENLKPSSYNLTASKVAFIKEKDKTEDGDEKEKLIVKDEKIIIPPRKTAIIETEESIYVSKCITGTYHSRVKMVNKGLGHIGTTLDPCFFGVSAIAMNNTTDENIEINVGDPIVTIMFYTLKSRCAGMHDNMTARIDDNITLDITNFYDFKEEKNTNNISDKKTMCGKCEECENKDKCTYKENKYEDENRRKIIEEIKKWKSEPYIHTKEALIRKVREEIKKDNTNKDIFYYSLFTLVLEIIFIIFLLWLIKNIEDKDLKEALKSIITITIPTVVAIIAIIANYKTKYKEEH